ncbi:MAG: hypothetical protein ACI4JN_06760 [Ruminococcus sp.]
MGEAQWWLYDLVVISIAVLCIWNGMNGGAFRSCGSLVIGIVSCLAASVFSGPVSELAYNAFFKESCQSVISHQLSKNDITGNIRAELENNGIYLPYDNEQIADILDGFSTDDPAVQQAAAMYGLSPSELEREIAGAIDYAIETHDEIIPDWASDAVKKADGSIDVDTAADTAASILRSDYNQASEQIEKNYIKPAITGILKVIAFTVIASVLATVLRTAVLVLPRKKDSYTGMVIGGILGAAKAGIYLYIIVLLVECISSMQSGDYPFYSQRTINQTYLFRIFYEMWQ